jgi:Uma2 family endonuclease
MSRLAAPPVIEYPDDDGNPLSDNTLQFRWIMTLQGGFDALFRDDPNVFVAGNLLWYPVEGDVNTRQAPDVMVAFGRPKGYRGSYRQWEEGGVAPQVAFEVLSPGNRSGEMARKLLFYEQYGVEEYYVYDPDRVRLDAHLRGTDDRFKPVSRIDGHVSPRTGVRFDMSGEELSVVKPDGSRFLTYVELVARAGQAEDDRRRAEAERRRAEVERAAIESQFDQLKEKLRAAGIDPDALG